MLSFTEEDIETLHQVSITTELKPVQPQQMSLIEMLKNKFALLNDYPQMNFYFIRFPDELVPMQRQGQRFQCFGKCTTRSEERRVGKECRSRWSPYH